MKFKCEKCRFVILLSVRISHSGVLCCTFDVFVMFAPFGSAALLCLCFLVVRQQVSDR